MSNEEQIKVQYKTIEELTEAAKAKFSDTEIENFISMGKRLACYPVLSELINVIEAAPTFATDSIGRKLIENITATMEYKQCGHIQLPFRDDNGEPMLKDGIDEIGIGMSLSITKRDEVPSFYVPQEFVPAVVDQMTNLRNTAITYWATYVKKHTKLMRKLQKYRPDVDFGLLNVDKTNPILMYFDEKSPTRVCIFTYYFNVSTKKIYFKKQ